MTNTFCTDNSKTNYSAQQCPCGLAEPSLQVKGIHFTHQPLNCPKSLTSSCNTFAILLKKRYQPFFILMHPTNIGQHTLLVPCPKSPLMPLNQQNRHSRALASPLGLGQTLKLFNSFPHKHYPQNCCTANIQTSILFGRTTDFSCISTQFSSGRATFRLANSDKFERTQEKQQKLSIHGDTHNPAGHRHKQAALADSVRAEVWIRCFQAVPANLNHPVILQTHFLMIKRWDLLQKDWLLRVFKLSLADHLQPHSKDGSPFTTGRWLGIESRQHMGMLGFG